MDRKQYDGEPFKIIGRRSVDGPDELVAYTRKPMDAALMAPHRACGWTALRYRNVQNRRTGDA